MDTIKEITQNKERYLTKSDRYQISATSSIKPLDLPFGPDIEGLVPVLEVDGIIVNIGEYKLISQATLDTIKQSNNPHYDTKDNGMVGKVKIGQTIPTITIDISKLISVGRERDIQNRVGGVTDVDYIFEGDVIPNTNISKNLVNQINYTLNPDWERPLDTYTLAQLQLSDIKNYDISALTIVTAQDSGSIFDYSKMQTFLTGVKERMKALNRDFNLIKDIHYKGIIPNNATLYSVTKQASAEDEQEVGDFTITYKTSDMVDVVPTPANNLSPTGSTDVMAGGGGGANAGGSNASPNTGGPGSTSGGGLVNAGGGGGGVPNYPTDGSGQGNTTNEQK